VVRAVCEEKLVPFADERIDILETLISV